MKQPTQTQSQQTSNADGSVPEKSRKRLLIWCRLLVVVVFTFPLLFCSVTQRSVNGSLTVLTLRGTDIRLYHADSGNVALARQTDAAMWIPPEWQVTHRTKGKWLITNIILFYLCLPYLMLS